MKWRRSKMQFVTQFGLLNGLSSDTQTVERDCLIIAM